MRAQYVAFGLVSLTKAGPCDIYKTGNTPCVAAHSTTRALYKTYNSHLYQVSRGSDGATKDILPLNPGGVANAATQDSFCAKDTCVITIIYDQTGNNNHLTRAPAGHAAPHPDKLASATAAPVTLGGKKAYGVSIAPGMGYRNDETRGIAINDEPEGMYAVLDGTHYDGKCCFDYGNAETSNNDTGNGHMEAINFSNSVGQKHSTGEGAGPWIRADLENGLYAWKNLSPNPNSPSIDFRFVTAVLKGKADFWAIRGGNAATGKLSTYWSGARPANGYTKMKKEGAIILGIGGDNSDGGQGTFYEGVMTQGYPSDDTEDSVQTNIVAAAYGA